MKLLNRDPDFTPFLDSDAEKQTVLLACPAKVNLFLRITGRRADGYHELISLMSKIDLYDELFIQRLKKPVVRFRCLTHPELENAENLVVRVAKELLPSGAGIELHLKKRIPAGAGLGGGSSDAAATIIGMNRLFKLNLEENKQQQIAAKFGADVPLFLLPTTSAVATGIGTQLQPLTNLPRLHLALVFPKFPVVTAWAYQAFAEQHKLEPGQNVLTLSSRNDSEFLTSWASGGTKFSVQRSNQNISIESLIQDMHNDLEPVVSAKHREISTMKERLLSTGARAAIMTGSGSCVIGLYDDAAAATRAAAEIEAQTGWWSRAVKSLKIPQPERASADAAT